MNKFEIKVIEGTTYRDFDGFDGYSYSMILVGVPQVNLNETN